MSDSVEVRECAAADVAVLDAHIPTGRNAVHATRPVSSGRRPSTSGC